MKKTCVLIVLLITFSCMQTPKTIEVEDVTINTNQGTSLLGTPLESRQLEPKDSAKVKKYIAAFDNYSTNPLEPEHIIWHGRRMAYLGDYQAAISIFNEGVLKYPLDARFFRHRGHRYISTRQLDLAIRDFEEAKRLIQGTEDVMEPDGIPNAMNTPVSSLHTNIYYHLGLAYYLKNDFKQALDNFESCLNASQNDDMIVASKHWLFMILQRLELPESAASLLDNVSHDMTIIENDGYHQLLLFYKGELSEPELTSNGSLGSSEAVQYGVANWHHYNGALDKAQTLYQSIVDNGNWAAFGYIAAEADLNRLNSEDDIVKEAK